MMVIMFAILSLLVFAVFFNIHLNILRTQNHEKMSVIYDRMEFVIAKENIKVDNDIIRYLMGHKRVVVNSEYADIQVLSAICLSMKKNELNKCISDYNRMIKKCPGNLLELGKEFDSYLIKSIKLSRYKPDYLFFLIRNTLYSRYSSAISVFFKEIKKNGSACNIIALNNTKLAMCAC